VPNFLTEKDYSSPEVEKWYSWEAELEHPMIAHRVDDED